MENASLPIYFIVAGGRPALAAAVAAPIEGWTVAFGLIRAC